MEGERGRDHVLQLTASDATCLLSADTAEELQAWVALFADGWVEEGAKEAGGGEGGGGAGFGELMGRMLSLKPQTKAVRDSAALGLGRTATLGFGRTSTATRSKAAPLPKTRSLMPGRKAVTVPPTAAPHQDASQGGCSIVEEEEEEEEEESAAELYSGYMAKKGDGFAAGWKQKWLVLHADGGLTYADSEAKPPTGRIELAGARKQDLQRSKSSSSSDYSFSIKAIKVKWYLNPGTEKAFDEWEQKLMSVMKG